MKLTLIRFYWRNLNIKSTLNTIFSSLIAPALFLCYEVIYIHQADVLP